MHLIGRGGRIVGGGLLALLIATRSASAGLFDDAPKPAAPPAARNATNPSEPTTTRPAATQPSGDSADAAYHDALHKARLDYCQAVVDADQKLLEQIDAARKAAVRAGNDEQVERLDRRSEAAAARLREHQAALAAARSGERPLLVSASFGRGKKWADVTDAVRGLLEATGAVRANPDTLGADPDPGWRKRLEIVYTLDGERHSVMIDEDGEIRVEGLIPAEPGSP